MNDTSVPSSSPSDHTDEALPLVFWPALAVGSALIAFGVWTAHHTSRDARPWTIIRWAVTFGVAHDAVVVPVTLAVAWLVELALGTARRPVRRVVGSSIALSAIAAAFSWPAVRRYGERPDNPSALPFDYTRHLLIVLGVIWGVALLRIVVAFARPTRAAR